MTEEFNINNFGAWLTKELKEKHITVKYIAFRVGVSEQAVCMYKKGKRFPTYETLAAIYDTLGYKLTTTKVREVEAWQQ